MPLVYQQNINETAKIGVWHITESEDFFLETVFPQKEINHPHKKLQHLAGRYLLKKIGKDFPLDLIKVNSAGKPYLEKENCTLFEAAIQAGQKIIRIDVLKKTGKKLHLIEVKAKSHHSEADEAKQKKKLEKYIEDVAFQYMVLTEAYPEFEIECSLLTPDKAKRTQIDGLAGWFSIQAGSDSTKELQEIITQSKPRFIKPEVVFKYENDPERAQYLSALIEDGILGYLPVTNEVKQIHSVIQNRANLFLYILN
jgi:Holliday junction resolvase-like predicted endonuclease